MVAAVESTNDASETVSQFGAYEEEAIISFALDFPDLFIPMIHFIEPNLFTRLEVRFVIAWILKIYKDHDVIPTRQLLRDTIIRHLTVDDPYKQILSVTDRPSNPREVPIIRNRLIEWAKLKQYGLLYSDEALAAYHKRDFAKLAQIVEDANKIDNARYRGFWFFDKIDELLNPVNQIHYPTGFKKLDVALNDGGPSPGQVLIWLAATNVGKSMMLCNNTVNSITAGLDTLHISFEMTAQDAAKRILSALTSTPLKRLPDPVEHDLVRRKCRGVYATHQAKLAIYEMEPEECSVSTIRSLLDILRKVYGWTPKILVLDYLELMISRQPSHNENDYSRQKHVATEICGLAKSENVLVYSATQTNRSGTDAAVRAAQADLNKMAESYGKSMPVDYVVSLNQSEDEYNADPPIIRMYVAKNRFGPKFLLVSCSAHYCTMKIVEQP